MKEKSMRGIRYLGSLGLAGLLALGIGGWVAAQAQDEPTVRPALARMGPPHGAGAWLPPPGPAMDRWLDDLQASAEQREKLQQIATALRNDMQAQHAAAQAEQVQWMTLFTQAELDTKAIESLRKKIQARQDALSQRAAKALLDSSQVLTATQRQQWAELMKQRPPMGPDGARPAHGGHGHGRLG